MNPNSISKAIASVFLLLSTSAFATHNKAGEIRYQRIAPYSQVVGTSTVPVYNYSITVVKYMNTGNNIADRCVDTVYFGDGSKGIAPRINGNTLCGCGTYSNVLIGCGTIVNYPLAPVKISYYSVTHTYAGPGSYIISSSDPSRNAGIVNIPNSVNYSFYLNARLVVGSNGNNNSVIMQNEPIEPAYVNECYYHIPAAYDPDGDSLSYELTPCTGAFGQTIPGYAFPSAGAPGTFTINAENGLVTWCNPQLQGLYSYAITVKEWKWINCQPVLVGSVTRDIEVTVISTSANPTPMIFGPGPVCAAAGQLTGASATFSYMSTAAACTIAVFGDPIHTLGSGSGISYTGSNNSTVCNYWWYTTCGENRRSTYPIVMRYHSIQGMGRYFYVPVNIKLLPPTVEPKSLLTSTNSAQLKWTPKNTCGNITGYRIYRSVGTSTLLPTGCQQGIPAASGFSLVGTAGPNDSIYNDFNLWSIPNGSQGNYCVTSVNDQCEESTADSLLSAFLIVGLLENYLDEKLLSVYPVPFGNKCVVKSERSFNGFQLKLYGSDAKEVMQRTSEEQWTEIELNTAQIPNGIYLMKLETTEGTITKKIVKD